MMVHKNTPARIQRKRTAGWRMPDGAVYVGRPTVWGNQFKEGFSQRGAAASYARWLHSPEGAPMRRAARDELAGKDLACWCAEGTPCHADALLAVANATEESLRAGFGVWVVSAAGVDWAQATIASSREEVWDSLGAEFEHVEDITIVREPRLDYLARYGAIDDLDLFNQGWGEMCDGCGAVIQKSNENTPPNRVFSEGGLIHCSQRCADGEVPQ